MPTRRTQILRIRLNPEGLAALTVLAEQRGLPVPTPARDMILREPAAGPDDPREALARMRPDLESLVSAVG